MPGYRAMAALLALCLAAQLAYPLIGLPLHIAKDYGEGWNAYWAARAMAGAPLYTGPASPISNNYLPLSFYLFGWVGQLAGDQIVGGRLVSLAALLGCAGMIAAVVHRLGGERRWALASAATFLLYAAAFAWRYVGSNDPQWLAAATTLGALWLLVRRPRATWVEVVGAAALLIGGGLIKHNQVAAPIAITVWLACYRRALLPAWLAAAALFLAVALAWLRRDFGPILFDQVLHHHRVLNPAYALNAAQTLAGLLPEMGLAWLLWHRRRFAADCRIALVLMFAGLALVLGFGERLGTGVSINAHFDSFIGLAAAAGIALGRPAVMGHVARRRMAALVLLPPLLATLVMLPNRVARLAALPVDLARWNAAVAMVARTPGPVACEMPALCFWAGKPFVLDFYNYGQKLRLVGDPAGLGQAIARRRFPLLVVQHDKRFLAGDGRLPDAYNQAIAANYRPVLSLPDNLLLLQPRRAGSPGG